MKKIHLFAGLCAAALTLSACGPLPENVQETIVPAPVTKTNWAEPTAAVEPAVMEPTRIVDVASAPTMEPPFTVGHSNDHVIGNHVLPSPAPMTTFDPTPMAIHTNVAGTHQFDGTHNVGISHYGTGHNGYNYNNTYPNSYPTYNGVNGVRPFKVNTGSVWNGPSTYMLPIGTGNYAHQHLETVSQGYTSTQTAPHTVTTYSEPVIGTASATSTVTAQKNLFIRKAPGFNSEKCDVLPKGRTATLEYCEGMWCKVSYKGRSGWSSRKYLSF
ncbi:MAG: SH3 domain-containing protein [Alphaproteobacteria bacterium]